VARFSEGGGCYGEWLKIAFIIDKYERFSAARNLKWPAGVGEKLGKVGKWGGVKGANAGKTQPAKRHKIYATGRQIYRRRPPLFLLGY